MQRRITLLLVAFSVLLPLLGCYRTPVIEDTSVTTTQTFTETTQTPPTQEETTSPPETEETQPVTEPVDITIAWTPLCEEFIYLRNKENSKSIIGQIPVGADLVVEGWRGRYALVSYNGTQGYVSANYIQPKDPQYFEKRLQVVSPTNQYTYEQMVSDMESLQAAYPHLVQVGSIGTSEQGRDIPVLLLGDPNASKQVILQGAMHAREHFTAWLLMAIADNALATDYPVDTGVCYHIIPMSNPDGVVLSQNHALNSDQEAIYQQDLACGYTTADKASYAKLWKSNALGIDLNRNFPSGWENSLEHTEPSSSHYRGESPLCAAESKALADYTSSRSFDATLSFHSHGSVLYYQYGNNQAINDRSYSLALAVQASTGYTPVGGSDDTSGAGYKDWAIDALGIPSITVEIGSYTTPLEQRDIYNTFARFENFLPALSGWLAS